MHLFNLSFHMLKFLWKVLSFLISFLSFFQSHIECLLNCVLTFFSLIDFYRGNIFEFFIQLYLSISKISFLGFEMGNLLVF